MVRKENELKFIKGACEWSMLNRLLTKEQRTKGKTEHHVNITKTFLLYCLKKQYGRKAKYILMCFPVIFFVALLEGAVHDILLDFQKTGNIAVSNSSGNLGFKTCFLASLLHWILWIYTRINTRFSIFSTLTIKTKLVGLFLTK